MDQRPFLWILIVGFITAFFDSFGIGANDVANSFATSVGAKVLTLKQAVLIASVCEFLGAVLLGSHVTDTIRKKIVKPSTFDDEPYVLMYGMLCASISSGIWQAIATYLKWPVSTTHSTIGAVIGFALVYDASSIDTEKVSEVVTSWFISPLLAATITIVLLALNLVIVLKSKNPVRRAKMWMPVMVTITVTLITMFVIYKGTPQLDLDELELTEALWISIVVGIVGGIITFLGIQFGLFAKLMKFLEPCINRTDACFMKTVSALDCKRCMKKKKDNGPHVVRQFANTTDESVVDAEPTEVVAKTGEGDGEDEDKSSETTDTAENPVVTKAPVPMEDPVKTTEEVICNNCKREMMIARTKSVGGTTKALLVNKYESEKFTEMRVYDEEAETLYSWLQVFTAIVSSFAHGSNDIANSVAPLAAMYAIYINGTLEKKSDVPVWLLCVGGVGIVVGLATWGYRIIGRMGRELSGVTPSRGVCIELGAATTVLIASRLELPVSTTHCQVGSIVGSGLVDSFRKDGCSFSAIWNNKLPNVDLKIFGKIAFAWVITLPVTIGISSALFAFGHESP